MFMSFFIVLELHVSNKHHFTGFLSQFIQTSLMRTTQLKQKSSEIMFVDVCFHYECETYSRALVTCQGNPKTLLAAYQNQPKKEHSWKEI